MTTTEMSFSEIPEPWHSLLREHQMTYVMPDAFQKLVAEARGYAGELPGNYPPEIAGFVMGAADFAQFLHGLGYALVKTEAN